MRTSILITIVIVLVVAVFIVPRSCGATKLKWELHNTPFPKPKFEILLKINSIKETFSLLGEIFRASTIEYSTVQADVVKGNKKIYGNSIYISIPTGVTNDFKVGDYAALGMKSTKVALNIRKIPPPEKTPAKNEHLFNHTEPQRH